ncbi:hypothetical protein [Simiduia agarivorans]|uniref:Uncharacterized protein n=1 Tax=Simiduia agarivorans (strain DSM 21679 / JCM 13881 / BCRC 17597 / SA1) TaxID=1117647 RepID=K4KJX2_SIMAS|nr:hypothetical protein [Simiduia agarivorans]AFU98530.1 hypothetical protein M5M_06675 [Simiduia agarivorans SA1 = DSM 21679]
MKKQSLALVTMMALSGSVFAGEASVTPFVAGEAATAAGVNAAFDALVTAINDNNTRIAALEAAGASASVSGAQYQATVLGSLNRGDSTNLYITVGNYLQTYTMTFNEDATCSFTGQQEEGEVGLNGSVSSSSDPVSFDCTYAQTASNLTVTIPGDGDIAFTVSSDGSLLVGNNFVVESEGGSTSRSEANIFIGVRLAE